MTGRPSPLEVHYPEVAFGGFSDVDGTVRFYTRVQALLSPSATVLDVGCGRGSHAEDAVGFRRQLRIFQGEGRHVIGIDVDEAARQNPFLDEFHLIQGEAWPVASGSVDLCVSDYVLEHVPRPDRFFAEAARVLKPGGCLCLRTPNAWSYEILAARAVPGALQAAVLGRVQPQRKSEDVFPAVYRCNTADRIRRALRRAGFSAAVYAISAEPSYLRFSRLAYALGVLWHRWAPACLKSNLLAFGRKLDDSREPRMTPLTKYVLIQDEPFYLPGMLDKFLREFADSTAGVQVQPIRMGRRGALATAREFWGIYGTRYFFWKLRRMLGMRLKERVFNRWLGSTRRCYSIRAVARKYGVPVDDVADVNSPAFLDLLGRRNVQLIVSISGTQLYKKALREQVPAGIINCHGGLLPRYRGLMPSFWTLANGEREGGVSVHFVDEKLDNGPIVVQRRYRLYPRESLEAVMARSKDLAAEALIEAVRLIDAGDPPRLPNPAEEATSFSVPTRADVRRFLASGHRFF